MAPWKKALIWVVIIYLCLFAPHTVAHLIHQFTQATSVYTSHLN